MPFLFEEFGPFAKAMKADWMKTGPGSLMALSVAAMLIGGCGGAWTGDSPDSPMTQWEFPPIPSHAPDAIKRLLEGLDSPDPLERARAASLLGSMEGQAGLAVPSLLVALKDADRQVRRSAAEALGRIGDSGAVAPLIAIVECRDEDWGVRGGAAAALGRLRDPQATQPLVAALADTVSHVREAAAIALGEIGNPAAQEALQSTIRYDSDPAVRDAARMALDVMRPTGAADGTESPMT